MNVKWDERLGIVDKDGIQIIQILKIRTKKQRTYYGKLLRDAILKHGTYEEDCKKIKSYNEFLKRLKLNNLTIDDLAIHGCMTKNSLKNFKEHFNNCKNSKEEWKKFKQDDTTYYSIVIMNPDVAKRNKQRSSDE